MDAEKIITISFVLVVVYLWNRFIIPFFISVSIKMTKGTKNFGASDFLLRNKDRIIRYLQVFYWVGALIIAIGLLRNWPFKKRIP